MNEHDYGSLWQDWTALDERRRSERRRLDRTDLPRGFIVRIDSSDTPDPIALEVVEVSTGGMRIAVHPGPVPKLHDALTIELEGEDDTTTCVIQCGVVWVEYRDWVTVAGVNLQSVQSRTGASTPRLPWE